MKHKHEFRALNNNGVGHYGILLYCTKCGMAFTYDRNYKLLRADDYSC
jgi:hypothetical protein